MPRRAEAEDTDWSRIVSLYDLLLLAESIAQSSPSTAPSPSPCATAPKPASPSSSRWPPATSNPTASPTPRSADLLRRLGRND